jgi:hypothetical protein
MTQPDDGPAAPPVDLDALRRTSGLRLDRDGRWWHAAAPVEHERVVALFDRGLRVDDDGAVRLEVGAQWCYVEVAETAYVVRRVRGGEGPAPPTLILNDGSEEPLDPTTLMVRGDQDLYCRVKGGRCPARFLRDAYHQVVWRLEPDPAGGFRFRGYGGGHRVRPLDTPPGPVWRAEGEGS